MIKDNESLIGAVSEFGNAIPIYDDGFGALWIYRESLGVVGIVRAQSESDAWDCILDEILNPVSVEDIKSDPSDYYVCEREYHCTAPKDYSAGLCKCNEAKHSESRRCWKCRQFRTPDEVKMCNCTEKRDLDHHVYLTLSEGYHYQPNSGGGTGIVGTDLNGSALEILTEDMLKRLEITLSTETD